MPHIPVEGEDLFTEPPFDFLGDWKHNKCSWGAWDIYWRYLILLITAILISNGIAACCYLNIEKPALDARRVFKRK